MYQFERWRKLKKCPFCVGMAGLFPEITDFPAAFLFS